MGFFGSDHNDDTVAATGGNSALAVSLVEVHHLNRLKKGFIIKNTF